MRTRKILVSMAIILLVALSSVNGSAGATVQEGGFELFGYNLPADSDASRDVALGDVDGDGDLDILVANQDGQNRLYLNDGDVFTDATSTNLPADSDMSYGVALGGAGKGARVMAQASRLIITQHLCRLLHEEQKGNGNGQDLFFHSFSYHSLCSSPATFLYFAVVLKLVCPRCSWRSLSPPPESSCLTACTAKASLSR